MPVNKIIQGDTLEVLKTFESESVDCVITSPPYFALRSYLSKDHPDKSKEIGSENSMEEHIEVLMKIFKELKRVLKPSGSFWLNYGDAYGGSGMSVSYAGQNKGPNSILRDDLSYMPDVGHSRGKYDKCMLMLPERIALKMIDEQGWILRQKICWAKQVYFHKDKMTKGSAMPTSVKDRFNMTFEYLYHFVKNKKYYFNLDAVRIPALSSSYGLSAFNPSRPISGKNVKHPGGYKTFNYRVRDAKKKTGNPQFKASEEEIKNYKGKFQGNKEIETFGSPRARTQRKMDSYKVSNSERRDIGLYERMGENQNGKNMPNVWLIGTEPSKELHFARFPSALCEIPIKSSCPEKGIVLDPFAGSGTALKVARDLGRNYLGIELNPEYIKLANERLSQSILPL